MKRLLAKLEKRGLIYRIEHRKREKRWKVIAGAFRVAYQGSKAQVQAWLAAQLSSNGNGQLQCQPETKQVHICRGEAVVSLTVAPGGLSDVLWHESPRDHEELAAGMKAIEEVVT